MNRLNNKVAIVTGGAQGLGAAQCELLAAEGAKVVLADLQMEAAEAVVARIRAAGGDAIAVRHDIADAASWDAVVAQTLQHYQGFNVLVNNAGIDLRASIEDLSLEQWERVIRVNLTGTFLGVQRAVAHMKDHGGGSIVNLSSTTAKAPASITTAYSASKAAISNLTKSTALHCAQSRNGIRVNSVLPGPIATPMVVGTADAPAPPEVVAWIGSMIPMGRLGLPSEIAYAVLYLASDEASFCTGTELIVDGGFTSQ